MIGVGLLALAALALAFFALADDDPGAPGVAATPTPVVTQPPAPTPTVGGEPSPSGGATPAADATPAGQGTPAPAGTGDPAQWPEGRTAWTIVMDMTTSRDAAVRRAQQLTAEGVVVGVLYTDEFRGFESEAYVVFSGQYQTAREAAQAQRELGSAAAAGAYVRRIRPR